MILEDITRTVNTDNKLWFCGHSLGAAMATIMASRCYYAASIQDPVELYTYGSPRVGWPKYVKNLGVVHHRWRNNNDIVTTVPLAVMGYRHDGTEHYLNAYGNVRDATTWQKFKDKIRGAWMGIKQGKIDSFSDHSMTQYCAFLKNYAEGRQNPQY